MVEIRINKEIRSITEDFAIGFALRECVWIGAGIVVALTIGLILYLKLGMPLIMVTYLSLFAVTPFFAFGLFTYHEMTCLQLIRALKREYIDTDKVLVYGCCNPYAAPVVKSRRARLKRCRKEARKDEVANFKESIFRKKSKA